MVGCDGEHEIAHRVVRSRAPVMLDDAIGLVADEHLDALAEAALVEAVEPWGEPEKERHLVLVGADHQRNVGGDRGSGGLERTAGKDFSVDDGIEADAPAVGESHHADFLQDCGLRACDLGRRNAAELADLVGAQVQLGEQLARGFGAVIAAGHLHRWSTLNDRFMKEAVRRGHRHQHADLRAATALPEDGNVSGVAAESPDIVADPLERRDDVEHTGISGRREFFAADLLQLQVTERAEAVVDRHNDHVAPGAQIGSVVPGRIAGAGDERAAVTPEHHGASAPVVDGGGPHVEHQAIFAHRGKLATREQLQERGRKGECVVVLHRAVAEFEGVANAGEGLEFSGRHETAFTRGRFGVWDALENADSVRGDPANFSATGFDNNMIGHSRMPPREEVIASRERFVSRESTRIFELAGQGLAIDAQYRSRFSAVTVD